MPALLPQWEARCKLVALFALAFAIAAVQHVTLVAVAGGVVLLLYAVAGVPVARLVARLRYPGVLLLALLVLLPLASGGQVWLRVGGLSIYTDGVRAAVLVGGRFACIVTLAVLLLETTGMVPLIAALRRLGMPALLTDTALLFARYLHDIHATFAQTRRAARLRGFTLGVRQVGVLAQLVGTLLIRSYARSERIYHAMLLRGYGQAVHPAMLPPVRHYDVLAAGAVLLIAGGLVVAGVVCTNQGCL